MTKRFIEFMTQNSDDGELNCGFSDIVENEWYHTKDRVNAKKCVDLLNNLIGENEQLKQEKKRLIGYLHRYGFVDVEDVDEVVLSKEYLDEWGELYNDER